jgi:UDP-N-acetylglucosamine 2-epimerase
MWARKNKDRPVSGFFTKTAHVQVTNFIPVKVFTLYTGCLMKNASTHNFVIYYPISMNKKIKDMVYQALQNSHKMFFSTRVWKTSTL